jgi:hypothetical protein
MPIKNKDITFTISDKDLRFIGTVGNKIIQDRTEAGIDKDGNPFDPYSTDWFAMPAGGMLKKDRKIMDDLNRSGDLSYFTTKAGKLWMLVRGYDIFKKNFNPSEYVGNVNLRSTGDMLDSMIVTKVDKANGTFQIGWQDTELAERAYWNQLRGREFLGFTKEERQKLESIAATKIEVVVKN